MEGPLPIARVLPQLSFSVIEPSVPWSAVAVVQVAEERDPELSLTDKVESSLASYIDYSFWNSGVTPNCLLCLS
jgi:hypothetical protein